MVDEQDILRLLIIEDSLNDAETFVSTLRGAGYAVRAKQVRQPEELQAALAEQQLELVICAAPTPGFSIEDAAAVIARSERDVPLVAVIERATQEDLVAAMHLGARDAIPKGQNEHLRLVVNRELTDLRARRMLRATEQRYREAEKRNRALLNSARDAVTYMTDGMHIRANEAYLELFGLESPDEIDGMPLMDMIAPEDHPKMKKFLRGLPELGEGRQKIDVIGQRADGATVPLHMVFSRATIDDEDCFQVVIPAATENSNQELEDKIRTLSSRDLLTGLYNRQYFMEELELAFGEVINNNAQCALLLLGIDRFADIAGAVGIAASDLVVVDAADELASRLDKDQLLARLSDQVFAVLSPYQNPADAESLAEQLRAYIEARTSEVADTKVSLTASIGIALVSENASNAQEILRRAQECLDAATAKGGNQVKVYSPPALDAATENSADVLAQVIKAALAKDRFTLLYQPISSLQGDDEERYEVFVRLADDGGNEFPTRQLVAAAERTGLMLELDRWVATRAIERLGEEHRKGRQLHFFLNICEASLCDDDYVPWIAGKLKEARLPGQFLTLEITEPAASGNAGPMKRMLKGLKALHSSLALAQFGSGLNSENFLRQVQPDFIKIDRSFVGDLATNPENQEAVRQLVAGAKELGIRVIAEYVEDANAMPLLWQYGVDFIQGFFLQQPSESLTFDFSGESV